MGLLDIFKRSKNIYIKEEDKYTGLIQYYECRTDKDKTIAKNIARCPKNAHIETLGIGDGIHPIFKEAISKYKREFSEKSRNNNNRFMIELYKLEEIEHNDTVKKAYETYINFKNKLKEKCKSYGILNEMNKQEAFERILNRIDEECRRKSKDIGFEITSNVDICRTEKSIENELENQLKGEYNAHKFTQVRYEITDYYYSFMEKFPWLLEIIEKERITENEKLVLERYAETFEALPKIVQTIAYLDSCLEKIEIEKIKKIRERHTTRSCE